MEDQVPLAHKAARSTVASRAPFTAEKASRSARPFGAIASQTFEPAAQGRVKITQIIRENRALWDLCAITEIPFDDAPKISKAHTADVR